MVLSEDMDQVYQAIDRNEVIVFASSLYYSIPANFKAVIDRLYTLYSRGHLKRGDALLIAAIDSTQSLQRY